MGQRGDRAEPRIVGDAFVFVDRELAIGIHPAEESNRTQTGRRVLPYARRHAAYVDRIHFERLAGRGQNFAALVARNHRPACRPGPADGRSEIACLCRHDQSPPNRRPAGPGSHWARAIPKAPSRALVRGVWAVDTIAASRISGRFLSSFACAILVWRFMQMPGTVARREARFSECQV